MSVVDESVHPPALSLPSWSSSPGTVDPSAASVLILCLGDDPKALEVATGWRDVAVAMCPTTLTHLPRLTGPDDTGAVREQLHEQRTGVRVMVVGSQHDVLVANAEAYAAGMFPGEITAFVTDSSDLPMYCAHCRDTYRVEGEPGGEVDCPGCGRRLEIHAHLSKVRGSFLASDVKAREVS